MKKIKIIISLLFISLLFITGCSKEKVTGNTLTDVEPGIYIGEINETTGFIPKLTLNEDKTYEFQVSKQYVYKGNYHVDNNMLILTLTEEKSFTFFDVNGKLTLNEEIPETMPRLTHFTLWGSFKEKIQENQPEISTEEIKD